MLLLAVSSSLKTVDDDKVCNVFKLKTEMHLFVLLQVFLSIVESTEAGHLLIK